MRMFVPAFNFTPVRFRLVRLQAWRFAPEVTALHVAECGRTGDDFEALLVTVAVRAMTVTLYEVPLTSPVIEQDVDAVWQVAPPGLAVAR